LRGESAPDYSWIKIMSEIDLGFNLRFSA